MEVFLPLLPTSTGLPERSDQHSTRPLACPEEHWVWPLADSQANLTEPEKPKPYSSVFPNKPCAHSDKLCEVTRSAARKGPLLYPQRLSLAYGFYVCTSGQRYVDLSTIIKMQHHLHYAAVLTQVIVDRQSSPIVQASYLAREPCRYSQCCCGYGCSNPETIFSKFRRIQAYLRQCLSHMAHKSLSLQF